MWFLWSLATAGTAAAAATPTPTPRPKLSGGFGRARATPVAPAVSEGGQSLADVVRSAQGTRGDGSGEKEKSNITIDNKTLVKDAGKGRLTTSSMGPAKAPAPAPTHAAAAAVADATASSVAASGNAESGGEAEWRNTARRERKRVEDAKTRIADLTATSRKLENDFYAWDDGQYRDRVIKPSWDRAKTDLEQAKVELEAAEKELADLPERARRAGALPGWIRE
jgi:hypothetical protein